MDEAQAPVGGNDVNAQLQNELELLRANSKKQINELKNTRAANEDLQRQISDLQTNQQKAKQSQLAEAGEFKTLWQEATGTVSSLQDQIAELKQQLQDKDAAFQQQQIKSAALNAFSQSGVHSPEHMFTLMKENLRMKEGNLVALSGGVEVPLNDHLEALKGPGSGMDYFFVGSGARGMSAAGSSSSTAGGKSWSGMTLTERIQLEMENPQRAEQLKAAG